MLPLWLKRRALPQMQSAQLRRNEPPLEHVIFQRFDDKWYPRHHLRDEPMVNRGNKYKMIPSSKPNWCKRGPREFQDNYKFVRQENGLDGALIDQQRPLGR